MIATLLLTCLAMQRGAPELAPSISTPDVGPPTAAVPPVFVENRGQWPAAARLRANRAGASAWLVDGGWWLALRSPEGEKGAAVRMRFEGSPPAAPLGEEPLGGPHHFFVGSDPARWASGCRGFARARWSGAWPGVDVVARGGGTLFEYDLLVAPGAGIEGAVVAVEGHRGIDLAPDGSLVVATAAGELRQPPPVAWQVLPGGGRAPLACRFRILGPDRFGFEAPGRDPSLAAVIDPALVWSTFLSGTGEQRIDAIARGPGGTAVVAGTTLSADFPVTPGAFDPLANGGFDAFVTALASDGRSLLWSTFLGGQDDETLRGLAVGPSGAATVVGDTRSSDFPTTPGSFDTTPNGFLDGFAARLDPSGASLSWSTYLGGGLNDRCLGVALDTAGGAVVVGATNGAGFPVVPGSYDSSFNGGVFSGDAFALRLDPGGAQLTWSTFLGGAADEGATAVAVDLAGEVTVAGLTTSAGFPTTPGAFDRTLDGPYDAFLLRLDAAGSALRFATFLGGSQTEEVRALAVDVSGTTLAVGTTDSPDFPTTAAAFDTSFEGPTEAFAARISQDGRQLAACTLLGAAGEEEASAVAIDPQLFVVVGGSTNSPGFPTTPGAFDRTLSGDPQALPFDGFVARLTADLGTLDYGTFFGGSGGDRLQGLALLASGDLLLGGVTVSIDFPTSPGAWQGSFNTLATTEGFASRLALLLHPIPYGAGKPNAWGAEPELVWNGFPSLADQGFELVLQSGMSGQRAIIFHGAARASVPFFGGTLLAAPPLRRDGSLQLDLFGYGLLALPIDATMVGQTLRYQAWFVDPGISFGVGLSRGLEVLFHP